MRRPELEHAIRAATEIIAEDEVVVIGSQAILGTWTEDELPVEATQSVEVDMVPLGDDDAGALATKLDAFIRVRARSGRPHRPRRSRPAS